MGVIARDIGIGSNAFVISVGRVWSIVEIAEEILCETDIDILQEAGGIKEFLNKEKFMVEDIALEEYEVYYEIVEEDEETLIFNPEFSKIKITSIERI